TTPEVELRGNIAGFTTGGTTFQIGIVTINFVPGTTDIDVPGGIDNGKYVEIEGVLQNATTVLASSIEEEDEDFGESVDDISMQGAVADMASGISNFLVGSQRVDASGIAGLTLMDGMNIKVEGKIEGSKLIADEVEIRDSDTKLRTFVNDVIPGNTAFRVNYLPLAGTVTVRTNAQTLFEDKTGVVLKNFSVDDLAATDFVRIEGQEVNDEVVASVIKRVDSVGQDLKLEGAVDSHFDNVSITILGIEYVIDPGGETGFEQFGDSSTLFFAVMEDGDFVEIEDKFPANGIADEVELE
ncbi:MAG: DUF5666 domain-containing protein, partial [Gammaproteobacteria bacterium]|nr:DUF5666 domain-containing protein [Gammaproteobacteria bacterium]